ncbi:MAG: response regulator, partial [Luteibacter sp.]
STTRRFGGSGLGLTISRSLVQLLGGDIAMRGTLGQGTRVTVDLDMAIAPHGAHDARVSAPVPVTTTPLDVLVAEDNPVNRQLVAAQLGRLGHRCRVACDGAEALAMADSGPVDVLLTDLHMPSMDGYALTRALREKGARVRIVVMTADVMAGERERCLAAGADAFVGKPLRFAALREAIGPGDAVPGGSDTGWDTDLWRETFGDIGVLPVMVGRFQASLGEDIERLPTPCTAREAAEWAHRILGGMRIFGESPEATVMETHERAWRAMAASAPADDLDALVPLLRGFVSRLHAAVAQFEPH